MKTARPIIAPAAALAAGIALFAVGCAAPQDEPIRFGTAPAPATDIQPHLVAEEDHNAVVLGAGDRFGNRLYNRYLEREQARQSRAARELADSAD